MNAMGWPLAYALTLWVGELIEEASEDVEKAEAAEGARAHGAT